MDVEFLKENCAERVYVMFVDSADQRLNRKADEFKYAIKDEYGEIVTDLPMGIDTMANRVNNPFDYVITFQEPFENVVSLEILEAYVPTAPLRDMNSQKTSQEEILRYITVSCPDIEQHIKRNRRNDFSVGMAKIGWESLEDKNFLHYRSPFTKRYFHPIGRLGKVNVRFLKNNNHDQFIEFKGAHHTLLLSITTMEPVQKGAPEYVLNPEYHPNQVPDFLSSMHIAEFDEEEL